MDFETKINKVIERYKKEGIAVIHKIPVEVTMIRKGANIVNAFPKSRSISDYLGSYKFKPLALEAKRHDNKTSFSLANIKDHQFEFFKQWCEHGLGYYIIWFRSLGRTFLIEAMKVQEFKDNNERKSIPLDWFEENATEVDDSLDFIKYVG